MGKYYINQYIKNIKNKDQIIIYPKYADHVSVDAAALAEIRGYIEKKIVCDVLLYCPFNNSVQNSYTKVIAFNDSGIYAFNGIHDDDDVNNKIRFIVCDLTQDQYIGLAEVQKAVGNKNYFNISERDYNNTYYLCDDSTQKFICVDGKLVVVDQDDNEGKIIALNITDKNAPDGEYGNITYEVLQKLKGLVVV